MSQDRWPELIQDHCAKIHFLTPAWQKDSCDNVDADVLINDDKTAQLGNNVMQFHTTYYTHYAEMELNLLSKK